MRILDTSALLEGERDGLILMCVIEELDRLKTADRAIAKSARKVIKDIYKTLMGNIRDEGEVRKGMPTDQVLLEWAEATESTLVTADLSLFLQARGRDIDSIFIDGSKNEFRLKPTATYLTDEQYSEIMESRYEGQHPENHFLIYDDQAYRIVNGNPISVKYRIMKDTFSGDIKPKNVEQKCLIDLMHSEVPVVAVHSKFGCGKSYLMLNHILGELSEGKYKKFIVIPNNSIATQSREVGTLPGDLLEKEFVFLGPIIDLMGKEVVQDMIMREQLEVAPLAFTRGRNWDDSIILVSEAQNLTDYHVKLLLGRIGKNSRIFFDGDVRQEDNKVFTENSGLVLLHRLAETAEANMFGSVELKTIERSHVARLADILDRIDDEE